MKEHTTTCHLGRKSNQHVIKPLGPTTNLPEIHRVEEHAKWHHEDATNKIDQELCFVHGVSWVQIKCLVYGRCLINIYWRKKEQEEVREGEKERRREDETERDVQSMYGLRKQKRIVWLEQSMSVERNMRIHMKWLVLTTPIRELTFTSSNWESAIRHCK